MVMCHAQLTFIAVLRPDLPLTAAQAHREGYFGEETPATKRSRTDRGAVGTAFERRCAPPLRSLYPATQCLSSGPFLRQRCGAFSSGPCSKRRRSRCEEVASVRRRCVEDSCCCCCCWSACQGPRLRGLVSLIARVWSFTAPEEERVHGPGCRSRANPSQWHVRAS
jgi:hypothetical protein